VPFYVGSERPTIQLFDEFALMAIARPNKNRWQHVTLHDTFMNF
jgi:hypothetical protein